MDTVEIPEHPPIYSFNSKQDAALWVERGTSVRFRTSDKSYRSMTGELIDSGRVHFQKVNQLVGPVGIRGASPGDAFGIQIDSIEVGPSAFLVYPARWRNRTFGIAESKVVEVPIQNGFAHLPNIGKIAAIPMIGCIGIAPATGNHSALGPATSTGGNIVLVELVAGATIWFPVRCPGGLLSLGDLHVRMGRGEVVGAGLECAGVVTAILQTEKSIELVCPVAIDPTHIHFIGTHADDSAEAERIAVRAAWDWLAQDVSLSETTRLAICASLLDLNHGGPSGAIVVASFAWRSWLWRGSPGQCGHSSMPETTQ